jgi:hypothetical protein
MKRKQLILLVKAFDETNALADIDTGIREDRTKKAPCKHCGRSGALRTICNDCLCRHGRLEMLCEVCNGGPTL